MCSDDIVACTLIHLRLGLSAGDTRVETLVAMTQDENLCWARIIVRSLEDRPPGSDNVPQSQDGAVGRPSWFKAGSDVAKKTGLHCRLMQRGERSGGGSMQKITNAVSCVFLASLLVSDAE